MAKYSEGTLTIQGGSDLVYGDQNVDFATYADIGDAIVIWGIGQYYTIAEIVNAGCLRLDRAVPGVNGVSNLTYAIGADFTPVLDMPIIAQYSINTQLHADRFLSIIDRELFVKSPVIGGAFGTAPVGVLALGSSY